ncbi:MAG: TlpA disulfide reductase family protein [Actinomycetota bacterium]|nr:TlpA disulfide reductase family protein [Actinomycetota bacterium]
MSGITESPPSDGQENPGRTRKLIFLGLSLVLAILIVYAIVVSLSVGGSRSASSPLVEASGIEVGGPLVGKPAPDITLPLVSDPSRTIKLSQYFGHPVVLNFFASWCVPCKIELPEFATLAKLDAGKVQFFGVDENDTKAGGESILLQTGVGYPAVFDGSGQLELPYHLIGLPTTLFIDSKGIVVEEVAGQITLPMLSKDIAKIMGN